MFPSGGPVRTYGTRCEIKNVNSVRFAQQAIEYEARRQVDILEDGGEIKQETRLFDSRRGETRTMRSKEEAHDYRYFPDPDLLPLVLTRDYVDGIERTLPELPDEKAARLARDFGLSHEDAGVLTAERENADYFEAVAEGRDAKLAANWVIHDLFGALNNAGKGIGESPVPAGGLGGLIDLITDGTISGRIAKDVFEEMFATGAGAKSIVEAKGLTQVTDAGEIESVIDGILSGQEAKIAEYRAGKDKLFGFFVGQVMKQSGGRANPKLVNELLRRKLDG